MSDVEVRSTPNVEAGLMSDVSSRAFRPPGICRMIHIRLRFVDASLFVNSATSTT